MDTKEKILIKQEYKKVVPYDFIKNILLMKDI